MAEILFQKLKNIPGLEITAARQSNAVFVKIPQNLIKALRKTHFFYVWNESTFECRLMTSWDTEIQEIENFYKNLIELQGDTDETRTRSLS